MTDEQFQQYLLDQGGFTTPARVALRQRVLTKVKASRSNRVLSLAWSLQDALPHDCEWDWSGIRDSSYDAIAAMARAFRMKGAE
jgi:hypothetical protein